MDTSRFTKVLTFVAVLVVSGLLTGCSTPPNSTMNQNQSSDTESQESLPENEVSSSTDVSDLESELDETQILEEDFSDL